MSSRLDMSEEVFCVLNEQGWRHITSGARPFRYEGRSVMKGDR